MSLDQALENLKFEYEHLSQKSIPTLINCYALQACFKDPFQEVVGHIAITEILSICLTNSIIQLSSSDKPLLRI